MLLSFINLTASTKVVVFVTVIIFLVIISFAVTKSESLPFLTSFLTMSLSETIPKRR